MPFGSDPDSALRQPFSDQRGLREGGEILKKLLALRLSKYDPDPMRLQRPSVRPPIRAGKK